MKDKMLTREEAYDAVKTTRTVVEGFSVPDGPMYDGVYTALLWDELVALREALNSLLSD